jgi:hypothetical protein
MKKFILIVTATLFFAAPINSFGDFDGFNFDNMNFGNFDFDSMDFGGFGDDTDFGGLFGGDQGFGTNFENDFAYDTEESNPKKDSKKEAIKEPQSIEAAFKESLDPSIKKLSKKHKDSINTYLKAVSIALHALTTHCASFALGLKLKADLKPSADEAAEVSQLIDSIHTGSTYHTPLLYKEFTSLREQLISLPAALDPINKKFATLATSLNDSLDLPSAAQQKKQKDLFKETADIIKKKVTPLAADLKKVIAHKKVSEITATKKQKHQAKVRGSSASSSGGWSSNASRYFDDGYMSGGWGNSNTWGNNSDWGDSWGGGSNWDSGSWGGGNNWSGSSNYGSDSYRSSSSSSSNKSPSSSPTQIYGSAGNFKYDDFDDDDNQYSSKNKGSSSNSPESNTIDDLPIQDKIKQLILQVPKNLQKWQASYTAEKSPAGKIILIKSILEQKTFTGDIENLIKIFEYNALEESDKKLAKKESDFATTIIPFMPLMIHAATYSSPPFALYFEEKALATKENGNTQKARAVAEAQKRQRLYSYSQLIKLLGTIRSLMPTTPLFEAIVDELLKQATDILNKLSYFTTAPTNIFVSLDETLRLTTLSRQLFHEPIIIGYSTISNQTEDEKKSRTKKLAPIRERKELTTEAICTYLEAQYALSQSLINTITQATESLGIELGIPEEEPINFDQSAVVAAFNAQLSSIINTQPEEAREHLRSHLIPYNKTSYQNIEIQHALLLENLDHWHIKKIPVSSDTEDISQNDLEMEDDLHSTETNANIANTLDPELEQHATEANDLDW